MTWTIRNKYGRFRIRRRRKFFDGQYYLTLYSLNIPGYLIFVAEVSTPAKLCEAMKRGD